MTTLYSWNLEFCKQKLCEWNDTVCQQKFKIYLENLLGRDDINHIFYVWFYIRFTFGLL